MASSRLFRNLTLISLLFLIGSYGCEPKQSEYLTVKGGAATPQPNVQWPYTVVEGNDTATFYEPQVSEWQNYQHIKAWLAVSVKKTGEEKTIFGVMQFEADTRVDFVTRQVFISNLGVTEIRFPELDSEPIKRLIDFVKGQLLKESRPINLDLVMASLADTQREVKSTAVNIEPPEIFYRPQPALLLLIDGKPLESPIKGVEDLAFVVNTNWDLFKDNQNGSYYLLDKDRWLSAPKPKGPWDASNKVSDAFTRLPRDGMWKETLAHIPAKTWGEDVAPEIIVSFTPAELIVTRGKPEEKPIKGTSLSFVANTDSNLFKSNQTGLWYFLVAGRWFSSKGLIGPWAYATADLPSDFRLIPPDHEKADVLANVPGTLESKLAVIQSQIPVKASIVRNHAYVDVNYAGKPRFKKIKGTKLYHAANTSYDVLRYKKDYYVCYQGVWFIAKSPHGPFIAATAIPSEIYEIPPNHPLHHLTYVTIFEVTETTITTGYTAGYHHHYVHSGVVVWGTGWYYPPYWYYDYYYPVYYYYPYTYGIASSYNPATGTYRQTARVYGPYGGYGRSALYNPQTGTYGRAAYAWDSNSGYGVGHAYSPRTGVSMFTEQVYDDYQRWGETVVQRGNEWATISKYGDERGTRRDIETSKGGKGTVLTNGDTRVSLGQSGEGDIYAGKDGHVYKRDDEGWYKREEGDWSRIDDGEIEAAKERFGSEKEQIGQKLSEKGITGENARERLDGKSISSKRADAGRDLSESFKRQRSSRTGGTFKQLERDRRARSESRTRSSRYSNRSRSRGSFSGARGSFRGRR